MTKNGKIVAAVIVIILFVIGFWYFGKDSTTTTVNPGGDHVVNLQGCYVAKLAKDVYILNIQSQQGADVNGTLAFNNFEKDSSSGSFGGTLTDDILLGDYSFDSEGMHSDRQVIFKKSGDSLIEGFGNMKTVDNKEVFIDTKNVTFDPKSTFVKVPNCQETFTNSAGTVSFDYNAAFVAREGTSTPTLDWKLDALQKGVLLAKVTVPHGYMPSTNFSNATVTIGTSADKKAIASCLTEGNTSNISESNSSTTETVGGYQFTKFTTHDAAAGSRYDSTIYRGIVDGDCYAIDAVIHSTNPGVYEPSQGIKEFDQAKVQNELDKIVKSIKFNLASN